MDNLGHKIRKREKLLVMMKAKADLLRKKQPIKASRIDSDIQALEKEIEDLKKRGSDFEK